MSPDIIQIHFQTNINHVSNILHKLNGMEAILGVPDRNTTIFEKKIACIFPQGSATWVQPLEYLLHIIPITITVQSLRT